MWAIPETKDLSHSTGGPDEKPNLVSDGCDPKVVSTFHSYDLVEGKH